MGLKLCEELTSLSKKKNLQLSSFSPATWQPKDLKSQVHFYEFPHQSQLPCCLFFYTQILRYPESRLSLLFFTLRSI